MSGYLWKAFLEDDVATFRAVLESASYLARGGIHRGHTSGQVISFGLGTPGSLDNGNDNDGYVPPSGIVLTRADLNHRDNQGRTLLHLIASSKSSLAIEFARSLLEQSLVDIYMQDLESGWTALHRAFYHGNISVGIAILNRDMRDALDGISYSLKHAGGLIKIKDHEGNGPFDVLEQTLEHTGDVNPGLRNNSISSHSDSDDEQDQPSNPWTSLFNDSTRYGNFKSLEGHEAYTFGSNKNITLGFGDEDDRQFPERVSIRQPEYLMAETSEEFEATHSRLFKSNRIPSWLRYEPVLIHNVVMGRFSSAILSTDKSSNLHICGHGSGGRLGLGDERTRFQFTCVEGGGLAQKKIVAIALGHHHTLALSDNGEVFSWGTNTYGQLGYSLPVSKSKEPVQLLPRQIFGPIKREPICGIAASVNHSVVHTLYSLYAFGKNEGQLGIVDSDARSLEFQTTPRKVGGVKFSHAIVSTSAIERATVCLLSNKEVWVYANYGYSKISFPVVSMTNWFTAVEAERRGSSVRFHHHLTTSITKIAAAGETICGLSEGGAIYSFTVAKPSASTQSLSSSTTNPSKIRGALSTPQVIWSNKKTRLAARDVAVDQNGSIILVTEAGSVWKRVKRAKIKDATASGIGEYKPKDYKFSRISGLTSAIAVRASGIGAYAVVRQERKLPKDIRECQRTMESDLFKLCAFRNHAVKWKYSNSKLEYLLEGSLEPTSYIDPQSLDDGMAKYLANFDGGLDAAIKEAFADTKPYKSFLDPDVYLCSSTSDIQISVHRVLLGASGPIFREAVQNAFATTTALNDLSEVICSDSKVQLIFQGIDILTLFTFVYYLMTGIVLPLSKIASPDMMRHRFRRSRAELLKLAQHLQIEGLEDILKQRGARQNGYQTVLERFFVSRPFRPSLIPATDIMVCLADGEIPCHAAVLCQRCPFFSTLLHGRAQGRWLEGRHIEGGLIPIDLTHISSSAFECVLKWIYTDSMDSFADIGLKDLEDFIDKIIEILSIANELMMESLSLACQELLGNHGM
jgi:alpha-tubulin suppressor-like RCC1 family protein